MDEIVQFLARSLPWSLLAGEQLRTIVASMLVEYFPRGRCILEADGSVPDFLYIVRVGEVDLLRADRADSAQLVDRLGPGDTFDLAATASGAPPSCRILTREDCLLYLLPRAELLRLLALPDFHLQCLGSPGDRLRARLDRQGPVPPEDPFGGSVGGALSRPPVRCAPGVSIAEAAGLMRDAGVSSLVVEAEPRGIVTDRDLRCRVIAAGLSGETPISTVMSQPLLTISTEATLLEALLLMLDRDIHHLGVSRAGEVVGMLTSSDLLRRYTRGPVRLPRLVELSSSVEVFARYRQELDAVMASLWHRGVRANAINRAISLAHDVMVRRLLAGARRALGPPPSPFAWLALGSQGRLEVALRQDHRSALIYGEGATSDVASYFSELAALVAEKLRACGFDPAPLEPRCPSWVFCLPAASWLHQVRSWAAAASGLPDGLVAQVADARQLAGELEILPATRAALWQAGAAEALRGLALGLSGGEAVPLGVLRRQLLEADGALFERLDLEARAARPLTDLARALAIAAGDDAWTTAERLRRAGAAQIIDPPLTEALVAAHEWLAGLRLRRRIQGAATDSASADLLLVAELDDADRVALKDTFSALREARGCLAALGPGLVASGSWT